MATRRVRRSETAPDDSTPEETRKTNENTVPRTVWVTLLSFTAMMLIMPISTYFIVLHYYGNPTMSAVASVVTVNIVIFLYIVTAIRQDSQGDIKSAKKD